MKRGNRRKDVRRRERMEGMSDSVAGRTVVRAIGEIQFNGRWFEKGRTGWGYNERTKRYDRSGNIGQEMMCMSHS